MDKCIAKSCVAFTIALLMISGCQTKTAGKCLSINWRLAGETSALNGEKSSLRFQNLHSSCSKKNLQSVDEAAFLEGYERGLSRFCKTLYGFNHGLSGSSYNNTCPQNSEPDFLKGYFKGKIQHLSNELKKTTNLHSEAEDRLWRKERDFLIIQNEDPEQAKEEIDVLEVYREEARILSEKKRQLKKELSEAKVSYEESLF